MERVMTVPARKLSSEAIAAGIFALQQTYLSGLSPEARVWAAAHVVRLERELERRKKS